MSGAGLITVELCTGWLGNLLIPLLILLGVGAVVREILAIVAAIVGLEGGAGLLGPLKQLLQNLGILAQLGLKF